MLPLLYIVRMDVERDYVPEFVRWYDTRHAPDLINTGFHSCNAYHSVLAGPFVCNVYEIPDLGVLCSPAYGRVRQEDQQLMQEVLTKISNHSNTVFKQEVLAGVPAQALRSDTRPSRLGAVTAPVISTLRFDIDEARVGELRDWFAQVEAAAQSTRQGWLRSRLARQDGKHPLFPSKQAQWTVVTEWASTGHALADGAAENVIGRYTRTFGGALSRLEYHVGALSATLLNSDSWTV